MKRVFILFLMLSILFSSCKNSADEDSVDVLWTETSNGLTEKVVLKDTKTADAFRRLIAYYIKNNSTGELKGFGIMRTTSGDSTIYNGIIGFGRKNEPFENKFFDSYNICLGVSNITMTDTVEDLQPDEKTGDYRFMIFGYLSKTQIERIKEASIISIKAEKAHVRGRAEEYSNITRFAVNNEFIKAALKYL